MIILCSWAVDTILDQIYTDYGIAYVGKHFSESFTEWNKAFCDDITNAVNSLSSIHIGVTCSLEIRYHRIPNNIVATILRCDFNWRLLRNVERESNNERIKKGLPSLPPSRLLGTPPVNVAKSPRYWPKPTKPKFTLPPKMRILKGEYFNGLRIGYHNRRYIILDAKGKPLVEKWFDKKPKIFKYPFGRLGIIAHVSYNKALHAIGMDGKLYDMNKLWDDVYLQEAFMLIVNEMINEVIVSHKQMALLESRGKVIRMNESQLCSIIHTIVNKLIA